MNRWHRQEVFTEEEAADFLRISKRQIRKLVREGKLAVVREGPRFTRFLWGDLMDYMHQHRIAPIPRAQDMAALTAHRRQTEGWRSVCRLLMGEDDGGLSLMSTLRTYFPEDKGEALATLLRDLEWPELVQAGRTLADHLSVLEEKGTLTALVRACEALVQQLSETPGSRRDAAELGQGEEQREAIQEEPPTWSDTLTPCCHAAWRLPRLEEGHWKGARVCTQCGRIWSLAKLQEALAEQNQRES